MFRLLKNSPKLQIIVNITKYMMIKLTTKLRPSMRNALASCPGSCAALSFAVPLRFPHSSMLPQRSPLPCCISPQMIQAVMTRRAHDHVGLRRKQRLHWICYVFPSMSEALKIVAGSRTREALPLR